MFKHFPLKFSVTPPLLSPIEWESFKCYFPVCVYVTTKRISWSDRIGEILLDVSLYVSLKEEKYMLQIKSTWAVLLFH